MPGPINSTDPSLNRAFGSSLPDVLTTRAVTERDPLGPDNLYGTDGSIGSFPDVLDSPARNSALSATLASLADQNPDTIKQAIRYDPATGGYIVRLYDPFGRPTDIPVSRAEVADNIRRHGVSGNDELQGALGNDPVKSAINIWPAVIETAYAKAHDRDWSNGLDEGYGAIRREKSPDLVLHALTGNVGEHVGYVPVPLLPKEASLDLLGSRVRDALEHGRSVVLETQPERRSALEKLFGLPGAQDKLSDNQVFTVNKVYRDKNGEWQVDIYQQAGVSREQGPGYHSFYITVPLEKLVDTGGLKDFVLGPPRDLQPGGTFPFPFPFPLPGGPGGSTPGGGLPDDPSTRV